MFRSFTQPFSLPEAAQFTVLSATAGPVSSVLSLPPLPAYQFGWVIGLVDYIVETTVYFYERTQSLSIV